MESGFGSLSRFYAAFTKMCEQSPKEYRASMGGDGKG
jgi:AraC-like DNA-binding protein